MPLWVRATSRQLRRYHSHACACVGLQESSLSLMVTGSHIPDERNGIKIKRPNGEIPKEDEEGIRAQRGSVGAG